ncbi:hypothetical protein ACPXCE_06565 [Streptomyces sp. DT24]|uniref:hypothetical protein n=1 Tax=Streptomyces sp. DT24 TaxID=3416520 RepID=UPI003CED38DB
MPRGKALPKDLDPEIKEFAERLRALVDRSGLGIRGRPHGLRQVFVGSLLNGRLPTPKRAIIALADLTGTRQAHLVTKTKAADATARATLVSGTKGCTGPARE